MPRKQSRTGAWQGPGGSPGTTVKWASQEKDVQRFEGDMVICALAKSLPHPAAKTLGQLLSWPLGGAGHKML